MTANRVAARPRRVCTPPRCKHLRDPTSTSRTASPSGWQLRPHVGVAARREDLAQRRARGAGRRERRCRRSARSPTARAERCHRRERRRQPVASRGRPPRAHRLDDRPVMLADAARRAGRRAPPPPPPPPVGGSVPHDRAARRGGGGGGVLVAEAAVRPCARRSAPRPRRSVRVSRRLRKHAALRARREGARRRRGASAAAARRPAPARRRREKLAAARRRAVARSAPWRTGLSEMTRPRTPTRCGRRPRVARAQPSLLLARWPKLARTARFHARRALISTLLQDRASTTARRAPARPRPALRARARASALAPRSPRFRTVSRATSRARRFSRTLDARAISTMIPRRRDIAVCHAATATARPTRRSVRSRASVAAKAPALHQLRAAEVAAHDEVVSGPVHVEALGVDGAGEARRRAKSRRRGFAVGLRRRSPRAATPQRRSTGRSLRRRSAATSKKAGRGCAASGTSSARRARAGKNATHVARAVARRTD